MNDLIKAHVDWLAASGMSRGFIEDRERILRMFDRKLPFGLEQAVDTEIGAMLANPAWSAGTRWCYFSHLRSFYAWVTDPRRDGLDMNPMDTLRAPKRRKGVPRPVSAEEMGVLLSAARPWRTFVMLAALAGLRCMEIAGLVREDVTEQHLVIQRGKGGKSAVMRTNPLLWEELKPYPPGPLAYKRSGEPATAEWISMSAGLYFRNKLGLKGVTLHRLRHKYAMDLLAETGNLLLVKKGLRHEHVSSTEIYAEASNASLDVAIANLRLPI